MKPTCFASNKTARLGLLIGLVCAALLIYACFDPERTFFPKCPFYALTGWKCPGCGTQRAVHQLLHLHIGAAFRYNAALVLSLPLLAFLLLAWRLRLRYPKLYAATRSRYLSWALIVLLLLWWILRNVFGW
ncbi:MAG: DUF2752 domain-containing protein [Bacteroidales bacterium]|nr:DUF2752 domain-containing protein [Bacteroidales bacterium]